MRRSWNTQGHARQHKLVLDHRMLRLHVGRVVEIYSSMCEQQGRSRNRSADMRRTCVRLLTRFTCSRPIEALDRHHWAIVRTVRERQRILIPQCQSFTGADEVPPPLPCPSGACLPLLRRSHRRLFHSFEIPCTRTRTTKYPHTNSMKPTASFMSHGGLACHETRSERHD